MDIFLTPAEVPIHDSDGNLLATFFFESPPVPEAESFIAAFQASAKDSATDMWNMSVELLAARFLRVEGKLSREAPSRDDEDAVLEFIAELHPELLFKMAMETCVGAMDERAMGKFQVGRSSQRAQKPGAKPARTGSSSRSGRATGRASARPRKK